MIARARNKSRRGFQAALFEEEAKNDSHAEETVGYLAIYKRRNRGNLHGVPFSLASTKLNHRIKKTFGHNIWVQEEQSLDEELKHGKERYDLLVLDGLFFAQDVTTKGMNTSAPRRDTPDTVYLGKPDVTAFSTTTVSLAWQAASGAGAGNVASYRVLRDGVPVETIAGLSHISAGLEPATRYGFAIQALDLNGELLATSSTVEAVTESEQLPPGKPTGLEATNVTFSSITLKWQPPAEGEVTHYTVYRNGDLIATVTNPGFTDTNLKPETGYRYFVTASGAGGESSEGAELSVSTLPLPDTSPPTAPQWLSALEVSATQVRLGWQASTDNTGVALYKVFRDGEMIGETAETSFLDTGVEEAKSYSYSVIAVDVAGNQSPSSAAIEVKTPDVTAPGIPGGFSAIGDHRVVRLSWDPSNDNVAVAGYRVLRNGVLIATTAYTGYIDHDVSVGQTYEYTVEAFDTSDNSSGPSEIKEATVTEPPVSGAMLAETCSGCHGNDGLSKGPVIPTLAGMDKDYFVSVMQDFRNGVRHSTMMGRISKAYTDDELIRMGEYYSLLPFQPAPQTVNLERVLVGQALHVSECGSCHGDEGRDRGNGILAGQWLDYLNHTLDDFAEERSAGVPSAMLDRLMLLSADDRLSLAHFYASLGSDTQAPLAPESLAATEVTENTVTLTWIDADDNAEVVRYDIERDGTIVGSVGQSVFTDTGLAPGEIYGYRVFAVDVAGNSSLPTPTLAVRTEGEPVIGDPQISRGHDLWQANGCQTCHGVAANFAAGESLAVLMNAIETNRGGMAQFAHLSAQDLADIVAYIQDERDPGEPGGGGSSLAGVNLMNNEATLRKAAILLAGRLPSTDEVVASQDEAGLRITLRNLMQGERFGEFIYKTAALTFLSGGADIRDIDEDFPVYASLDNTLRYRALGDIRYEPLALTRYIVENDLPYSEILTADYTMITPRSAQIYGAEPLEPFTGTQDVNDGEYKPGRIPVVSHRTPELAVQPFPHAGVLTTYSWLSRFPTTDTNRNRHRASMMLRQFLGVDLETLGQRPLDDSENGDYLVPTMENPACLLCHTTMEPIAGAFQNWGNRNQYAQEGFDSLARDYKGTGYALDHYGMPWYELGDKWYLDMLAPGFDGKEMPGMHHGFGLAPLSDRLVDRTNWVATATSQRSDYYGASSAIDASVNTRWEGAFGTDTEPQEVPQEIMIDMGAEQEISAITYLPRNYRHIGEYGISVSDDAITWTEIERGIYPLDPGHGLKVIEFDPVTTRHFKVSVYSVGRGDSANIQDLNALAPAADPTVPFAENHNGGIDALQWLAREVVQDPRFTKGAVNLWYRGLFGRKPLSSPVDPNAPGYDQALAAYQLQENILESIATGIASSDLIIRDLLVELIMSDLFRAATTDSAVTPEQRAELAEVGMQRLLGPEELDAKGEATANTTFFNNPVSSYGLLYGGFDGGRDALDPNEDLTTSMLSTYESRLYRGMCDGRLLLNDLNRLPGERILMPFVEEIPFKDALGAPATGSFVIEHAGWLNTEDKTLDQFGSLGTDGNTPGFAGWTDAMDVPVNVGSYIGQRLRAVLVAPASGTYNFWIAGDDQASLFIADGEDVSNLVQVASVPGWTNHQQWDKYPEQASAGIELLAGQAYLVEAVGIERTGGDHLSVAWSGPGFTQQLMSAEHLRAVADPVSPQSDWVVTMIKENIVYLHERLLGEKLSISDPEVERTFQLFRSVYHNNTPEDSGLEVYCETRNGSQSMRRAWNAVLAYLMSDFYFLHE
ncbi:fibronectin type III domain-containing protein [Solemya velum gill symbiont]|nr:fibronectin type III domain-containing protein [Solemya velum gill symbiont]OOY48812.1 hypothetical protein BOV93_01630 [Solemya velum gill symbiont]